MDPIKIKLLDELMSHLSGMQAGQLKKLLDEQKMGSMGMDKDMGMDGVDKSSMDDAPESMMSDKPKGISVEKVSVMAKPKMGMDMMDKMGKDEPEDKMGMMGEKPDGMKDMMGGSGDDEMSDDELKEMLAKYLS